MGLDIGNKHIGIALSDPEEILASPLTTISREDDNRVINSIASLIRQYNVQCMVIGIPYTLNNLNSEQTDKTMSFVKNLAEKITGIEMIIQDERFTTVLANRLLHQSRIKKKRMNGHLDSASAALILQGYLDRIKTSDDSI